jgi:hypothetical protein
MSNGSDHAVKVFACTEFSEDSSEEVLSLSNYGTVLAVGTYRSDRANEYVRVYSYSDTESAWIQKGGDVDHDFNTSIGEISMRLSKDDLVVVVGYPAVLEYIIHIYSGKIWTSLTVILY